MGNYGDFLEVVQMKTDDIIPYDKNPRFNDNAVEAVAASIEEFGFQQPIVVDKDHVVIVGHTRLKAAKLLGRETVPVVVADLPADKANAYRLADNKTGVYIDAGTYVKSFYTVICMPSAVSISVMGAHSKRMHHKVAWDYCVPKILSGRWSKHGEG